MKLTSEIAFQMPRFQFNRNVATESQVWNVDTVLEVKTKGLKTRALPRTVVRILEASAGKDGNSEKRGYATAMLGNGTHLVSVTVDPASSNHAILSALRTGVSALLERNPATVAVCLPQDTDNAISSMITYVSWQSMCHPLQRQKAQAKERQVPYEKYRYTASRETTPNLQWLKAT